MKKSFLLCLLMTLFTTWAVQAQSTIFFSEDFEGGSMPSGWTTDGPGAWSVGRGDYYTTTGAGEGSYNARITHTSNDYVTKLITPAIDLSAASSAELSFMHIQRAWGGDYDFLAVYYRSKESEDWTLLADYSDAAAATWTQEEGIALPDLSDTYQIAFEFTDKYGYGLGIDMVQIMKPAACPKITGLTVSNIRARAVTLSWDATEVASLIHFMGSTESDFPDDADKTITFNYIPASLNTVDLADYAALGAVLKPETTYYVKLQANCGTDGLSDWSNVVSFTTTIACPAPTGLAAVLTPGNGSIATLNWESNASEWKVEYSTDSDFATAESKSITGAPTAPLTGLTAETTYYARVKAVCGGEDGESQWSSVISFTPTNAYFITINDNSDVLNYVPINGSYADYGTRSQFIIPASDLTSIVWGKIKQLKFYSNNEIASTKFGGAVFSIYMAEVGNTAFESADFVDWSTLDEVYSGSLSWDGKEWIFELDNTYQYEGGNLLIGFHETDFTTAYASIDWLGETQSDYTAVYQNANYSHVFSNTIYRQSFLPKMTIFYEPGEAPSCPKPIGFTVSDVTAHDATFTWTSDADAWELSILSSAGEAVFNVSGAASFNPEILDPETAYIAKVRAKCGDTYSDWSNSVNFTTTIACPVPTGLHAELTPGNGTVAKLIWNAGDAEEWVLQYSESPDFDPLRGQTVYGNAFYDLTGLTPETTYYARVSAYCGADDGMSEASEVISFTPTNALSITLCDGTTSNDKVPFEGYNADNAQHNQMIYPAESLAAMNGMNITQMVFYIDPSGNNGTYTAASRMGTWTVSLGETEATTLSGLDNTTSLTQVYEGYFDCSTGKLTIVFDAEYTYNGGNLLIDINHAAASYNRWYFYGVEATGASYSYGAQRNFLAKATFTYAEPAACAKPTGLTIEYNGGTEAIVSWTSDAAKWNLNVNGTIIPNVTENPYTIDCELATAYEVRVQAICDATSDWSKAVSFTTDLCLPEDMCEIRYVLDDQYDDSWNGASIKVYDKGTNELLATITDPSGVDKYEGTLAVCDGLELKFVWNNGNYDSECSYTFYDHNDEIIIQGSGALTTVEYTVDCTVPTCAKPTGLTADNITSNSAVLHWEYDAEAWQLCLDGDEDNLIPLTVSDYDWSALDPNSVHSFKVRTVCDSEESDWSAEFTFKTLCNAIDIPFVEGFEEDIDCWTVIDNNRPSERTSSASYEGDYSFVFQWNTVENLYQYLISPELGSTENNIELEFYYAIRSANYPEEFRVGYSMSSNDVEDDTWVWSDDIEATNVVGDGNWLPFNATLPVGTKYVAIAYTKADMYALFIDNISFIEANPCATPTNVVVTYEGGTEASINWDNAGAEKWNIDINDGEHFITDVTEVPFLISGLEYGKSYGVKVQAVCDEEHSSYWSDAIYFQTECYPYAHNLPFFEDFEHASLDCWTLVDCHSETHLYNDPNECYQGGTSFIFRYTTNPPQYLITPELAPMESNTKVEFLYRNLADMYPETFQVGYSVSTNEVESFIWDEEVTAQDSLTWMTYAHEFPGGVKYIAIKCTSNDMFYLAIDNISIDAVVPACETPMNPEVEYTEGLEALVSWTTNGAGMWNIDINGQFISGVTVVPYLLTELEYNTLYTVKVQTVCGDSYSDWSEEVSFTTNPNPEPELCEAQALPFHETFEEDSPSRNCWTVLNPSEGTGREQDDGGNYYYALYYPMSPQILISPELGQGDMRTRISFLFKCGYPGTPENFIVGYSTSGSTPDHFTWLEEMLAEDAAEWSRFAYVVDEHIKYVAIQYTSINQFALLIDEFQVEETDLPTGFEAVKNDAQIYKFVKDGNLFILRNGKLFNAQGKFVK